MTAEPLPLPIATDAIARLEKRLTNELSREAEEWSRCAVALTVWEDEHLLEKPTEDLLQQHKVTLEKLICLGQLLLRAIQHPDFPDQGVVGMVTATDRMLRDKVLLWHGTMTEGVRQKILAEVFP